MATMVHVFKNKGKIIFVLLQDICYDICMEMHWINACTNIWAKYSPHPQPHPQLQQEQSETA